MLKKLTYLKHHPSFIKYLENTSWVLGEKVLRLILGLFVGIWVARYLGPEKFGIFSYAHSLVGLFAVIATLGLDGIVVRELVKKPDKTGVLIFTAFVLKMIGAFFVLFLILLFNIFSSNDFATNTIVLIIAAATIFQSFNVIDFYFQSIVMNKYVVYVNTICLFISSLTKVLFIINESPLYYFVWLVVFDSFITACGYVFFYIKHRLTSASENKINFIFNYNSLKFSKRMACSLLNDSWPLIISGMVIAVYMKIDQVMINEILGTESVGQYAAAVRLSEAWYFIPMAIATTLFPALINAKKNSESLYNLRLQQLYDVMVWGAIFIAIPVTFMSDQIISFLYGELYNGAGTVLLIHIWAGIFVFLGIAFSKYLMIGNYKRKALYRTLLGAIINIILNLILIPVYGIEGAAVATLLGQLFANYIYDIFDKELRLQFWMKTKCFIPLHILKGYK